MHASCSRGTATTWSIVEVNPLLQTQGTPVLDTLLTEANAMAFDTVRNQLIFLSPSGSAPGMYLFDVGTQTLDKFAEVADMQFYNGQTPNGAAYMDGAYWSIPSGENKVQRAVLAYTAGKPSGVASVTTYTVDPSSVTLAPPDIAIDEISKVMYFPSFDGLRTINLSNLSGSTLPTASIGGDVLFYQCAFNADFTVLYGHDNLSGMWMTIDKATGAGTNIYTSTIKYNDLGGSSVFGVAGPSGGDCTTQYASVKTKVATSAKRGGLLRYRAYLKNGNKTLASIDELRLEVTLPAEVSVVSSSSNLKHRGVVGTAGASSFAWTNFNLTKHKLARFDLKTRVSTAATKGQVLDLTTTLYHERGGSTSCPQEFTLQVRVH